MLLLLYFDKFKYLRIVTYKELPWKYGETQSWGWGNHIFGVCTFGSPPLNSCTEICGPPLHWC